MVSMTSPLNAREYPDYHSINIAERVAPRRMLDTMRISLKILKEVTFTSVDAAKYYARKMTAYVASWPWRKKIIVMGVFLAGVAILLTLTIYLHIHLKKYSPQLQPLVPQNICDQETLQPYLNRYWAIFKNYSQEMSNYESICCSTGTFEHAISERDFNGIEGLRNGLANQSTFKILGSYYSPTSPTFSTEEMPNASLTINERAFYLVLSSLVDWQEGVMLGWISQWVELFSEVKIPVEIYREGLFAAIAALCMRPTQTVSIYLQSLRPICICTEQDFSYILSYITDQSHFRPANSTN